LLRDRILIRLRRRLRLRRWPVLRFGLGLRLRFALRLRLGGLRGLLALRLLRLRFRGLLRVLGGLGAAAVALVVRLVEPRALEDHAGAAADQPLELQLAALRALPQDGRGHAVDGLEE